MQIKDIEDEITDHVYYITTNDFKFSGVRFDERLK